MEEDNNNLKKMANDIIYKNGNDNGYFKDKYPKLYNMCILIRDTNNVEEKNKLMNMLNDLFDKRGSIQSGKVSDNDATMKFGLNVADTYIFNKFEKPNDEQINKAKQKLSDNYK